MNAAEVFMCESAARTTEVRRQAISLKVSGCHDPSCPPPQSPSPPARPPPSPPRSPSDTYSQALLSGLRAVIMPYSMRPSTKARCMISRHHASRTTWSGLGVGLGGGGGLGVGLCKSRGLGFGLGLGPGPGPGVGLA